MFWLPVTGLRPSTIQVHCPPCVCFIHYEQIQKISNIFPQITGDLIRAAMIVYAGALLLVMSFCSPYWIESYDESFSSFKKMGLWEYCFKDFYYPNYQFPKKFNGCHNIFSHVSGIAQLSVHHN